MKDYFRQFPGLDAGDKYDNKGFWELPTPVTSDITMFPNDVVIYDEDGYPLLRDFLKAQGIRPRPIDRLCHRHVFLPDDRRL